MDDLRTRFATLDAVPVPDIWSEVERRLEALGTTPPTRRLVAVTPEWRGDRAEPPRRPSTPLSARRTSARLAAALLIAAVLVGGAIAVGSGVVRLTSVVPPSPDATTTSPPAPTPSGPSPTPVTTPSPSVSAVSTLLPGARAFGLTSDTGGWLATGGAVYRTDDTARTWTEVRQQEFTTTSVAAFVDDDTMYVASGASPATIAATHDGGVSWVTSTLDLGPINGGPVFSFRSPLVGFATFFDPEGGNELAVYATADGGQTWTGPRDGHVAQMVPGGDTLNDPLGGFFWQRAGKSDGQPFDNRFFLSADGAASWIEYRFPTGPLSPKDALKEIVDIIQDDGGPITISIMVDGGDGAVYQGTDDPATWRSVRTLPGPDVQLLSATTWVVATSGAEFRSTVDAGAHWRTRVTSTPFRELPRFATPDTAWVTVSCNPDSILPQDAHCDGTTTVGMFLVTSDGGVTWTRLDR